MQIPTKVIFNKMRLLEGQDFFKKDDMLLGYLARKIQSVAESEAHVAKMIETWIGRTRAMLHPSDVEALARETASKPVLPPGCDVCKGEPIIYFASPTDPHYGTAGRCRCERGQALEKLDQARRDRERRGHERRAA